MSMIEGPILYAAGIGIVALALLTLGALVLVRSRRRAGFMKRRQGVSDAGALTSAGEPQTSSARQMPGVQHGPSVQVLAQPDPQSEAPERLRAEQDRKENDFLRRGKVVIKPEVEFVQLLLGDLMPVAVVPQALDNQWVTNELFNDIAQSAQEQSTCARW